MNIEAIHISQYNYPLPEERIAKYPLQQRDASRMLVYRQKTIKDSTFKDLPSLLPPETMLICNNTRVIQARLFFKRQSGANIEVFMLAPCLPSDYAVNFQQTHSCKWLCLIGNAKKWKEPVLKQVVNAPDGSAFTLNAQIIDRNSENAVIEFQWDNSHYCFAQILHMCGNLPIPPYLNRETEDSDLQTYQTAYSKIEGSVAAPTAGLHFTPQVLERLKQKGIRTGELTLHVGAGTFRPVKCETIERHTMHAEWFCVSRSLIEQMIDHKGSFALVGTTSLRAVESLFHIDWQGMEEEENAILKINQWQPYKSNQTDRTSPKEMLMKIADYMDRRNIEYLTAETQIILVPGYRFRLADILVTNFHQPRSTLLLLVAAFIGDDWRKVYQHALDHNYRFLSYGDSSLLFRNNP